MNFLYPAFLAALAALLIPIIIHLFNFRRVKRVFFTNVAFLKEVKEETASRSKLKHWLVLLCRMLALAALVLAFAQPYIPQAQSEVVQGSKTVSIYVDNSQSMNLQGSGVSLFEKSKIKAREIAEAYGPEDRFQLITNDLEGKHQRILGKDEFLGYLDEIGISNASRTLTEVVNRQKQAMRVEDSEQKNIYLLTDLQKNTVDLEIAADSSFKYYFVPLQSEQQQNVFIDSVWFSSPVRMLNQQNSLLARIRNTGDAEIEDSRLDLRINGQSKALKNFSIPPKSEIVDTINFTITETGLHQAEMKVQDYPIDFDDAYHFTFEVADQIEVLSIDRTGSGSKFVNALLKGVDNFKLTNKSVNQLDYPSLPKHQLIILSNTKTISSGLAQALEQYVNDGGSLLVFPSKDMDVSSYNSLLKNLQVNSYDKYVTEPREVDQINTQQEVFKDVFERLPRNVDLPIAKGRFEMSNYANTGEEILLRLKGGNSFLSKYSVGGGKLYLAASPLSLDASNLASHALFVPMVYRIALVGGRSTQLAYTIGDDEVIETKNRADRKESVFKLKGDEGEFIPGQKVLGSKLILSLNDQMKTPGIYALSMEGSEPLELFGFNLSRQESILDFLSLSELKERFNAPHITIIDRAETDLTHLVGKIDKGIVLWWWCLLAALGFLLLESLLLRFWKT